MRPSVKQASLLKKEQENKERNTQRKLFFNEINDVYKITKEILALRKKELKGVYVDNEPLDNEIAPLYVKLCEKVFPAIVPYMRALAERKLQDMVIDEMPTPTNKTDIN